MSDAMEEQLAAQVPAGWKTDPGELPSVYANLVAVTVTHDEVILTFGQRTTSEKEKVGWILPVAKVALPLSVLPSLTTILQNGLAKQKQDRTPKNARKKQQA